MVRILPLRIIDEMKHPRVVLTIIRVFAVFAIALQLISCSNGPLSPLISPSTSSTAISTENRRQLPENFDHESDTRSVKPLKEKLNGCWSGMKGGSLQFADGKVQHRLPDETLEFDYKILAELDHRYPETIILETDSDHLGFLDRIMKIRFADKDTIYVFTFRTVAAMEQDSFTGAGEFVRYECE